MSLYQNITAEPADAGAAVAVLIDYDGTIATIDVTDEMVRAASSEEEWLALEATYREGAMGSRALLEAETRLLPTDPADLPDMLRDHSLDPGFGPFVRYAQSRGIVIEVVSDGLDSSSGRASPHWVWVRSRSSRRPSHSWSRGQRSASLMAIPDACSAVRASGRESSIIRRPAGMWSSWATAIATSMRWHMRTPYSPREISWGFVGIARWPSNPGRRSMTCTRGSTTAWPRADSQPPSRGRSFAGRKPRATIPRDRHVRACDRGGG